VSKNIVAIFFDLGDTIMDEATEQKDAEGTTVAAGLLPGMGEALQRLHDQGYRLALVADARPNTPLNVLRQHGLLDRFEHLAISEVTGFEKPQAGIFLHALQAMGIPEADFPGVLMVGNNLERDILGANRLGLRSVFFHANERRRTVPDSLDEVPRHTVATAQELLDLVAALSLEVDGGQIPAVCGQPDALALAARFAPRLLFDAAEPFLPDAVGYTIFHRAEPSPSFPRRIQRDWRPAWDTAIEYAIWWDWDIGHLYELEHAWVYLDSQQTPVWVEASSHGAYASMILEDGRLSLDGERPLLYSQPGKHAFSPSAHWFEMFRDMVFAETGPHAGRDGVLVKREYAHQIAKTPEADQRVAAWLRQKAFTPTLQFSQSFDIRPDMLIPWPVLHTWIPRRVNWWLERL